MVLVCPPISTTTFGLFVIKSYNSFNTSYDSAFIWYESAAKNNLSILIFCPSLIFDASSSVKILGLGSEAGLVLGASGLGASGFGLFCTIGSSFLGSSGFSTQGTSTIFEALSTNTLPL